MRTEGRPLAFLWFRFVACPPKKDLRFEAEDGGVEKQTQSERLLESHGEVLNLRLREWVEIARMIAIAESANEAPTDFS